MLYSLSSTEIYIEKYQKFSAPKGEISYLHGNKAPQTYEADEVLFCSQVDARSMDNEEKGMWG